ncbi:hypothetical protein [Clostridium thermosuccinogenes]|nr:hypothetical protein [Pseudoclostridium thermosuccinogenes]
MKRKVCEYFSAQARIDLKALLPNRGKGSGDGYKIKSADSG